jgi:sugar/nucleoside kinase (ribokinase family)
LLLAAAAAAADAGGGGEETFLDSVVVRRGGLGAVLVSRERERALSVPCVGNLRLRDTTGAGNAFLGALAAAAAASPSLSDAALALGVASAASAAVAEVLGTPPLSADLLSPSNSQVERAAERALAVRNAGEEVEV